MERKYRIDSENENKFVILQIGRKYTYVGFSNLHKPVAVYNTPEIFVFNENFHDFEIDETNIQKICKLVSKKIKIKAAITENNQNEDELEFTELKRETETETENETTTKRETAFGTYCKSNDTYEYIEKEETEEKPEIEKEIEKETETQKETEKQKVTETEKVTEKQEQTETETTAKRETTFGTYYKNNDTSEYIEKGETGEQPKIEKEIEKGTEKQKEIEKRKETKEETEKEAEKEAEKETEKEKEGTKLKKFTTVEKKDALEKSDEEEEIEPSDAPFIYHYEYKYNQNFQLWSAFFEEYLLRIFQNLTRTTSKTKRVVLILNMFFPTIIKYTVCKCLLQNSEISSISYINDLVCPLYISNCITCVVVDLGYIHCRLLPVLNGFPLYHLYTYINNGGMYINKEIRKLLKQQYSEGYKKYRASLLKENMKQQCVSSTTEEGSYTNEYNMSINESHMDTNENSIDTDEQNPKSTTSEKNTGTIEMLKYYYELYDQKEIEDAIDAMSDDDIEILKIKYFYLKNEKHNFISDKYVLFEFKNYKIIIEPETRWKACEILFTKKYEHNLYSLFDNFIDKLDHLNYTVFYNIILCGGCSNIKGILSRIAEVICKCFQHRNKYLSNFKNNVHFVFPKVAPNIRQFVGASVYANLENLPEYTTEHIFNNVLYTNLNEDIYINFKK